MARRVSSMDRRQVLKGGALAIGIGGPTAREDALAFLARNSRISSTGY